MARDPRLVARSETNATTRQFRPEATHPVDDRALEAAPPVDVDELLLARDAELASGERWWVRIDRRHLWWDSIGGYTTYPTNAMRWSSRWDAYNAMLGEQVGQHTWDIEPVVYPRTVATTAKARLSEIAQGWTRALDAPSGRRRPADGVVHALVGDNVPAWALCGTEIGYWAAASWPPKGMRRCEQCNSIAATLPD